MGRLQDRVAVVTGSERNGEGMARLFASKGHISGRDEQKGRAVADSIVKSGGRAFSR
jgi:hypothetical protein